MSLASRSLFLIASAALVSGCEHLPLPAVTPVDLLSTQHDPRVGTKLALTESVVFLPGAIDAMFPAANDGSTSRLVGGNFAGSDPKFQTQCGLRLTRPVPRSSGEIRVQPGDFTIKRIVRESDPKSGDPRSITPYENNSIEATLSYRLDVSSQQQTAFPNGAQLREQAGNLINWFE